MSDCLNVRWVECQIGWLSDWLNVRLGVFRVFPSKIRHKKKRVTDRRTDGRTDRRTHPLIESGLTTKNALVAAYCCILCKLSGLLIEIISTAYCFIVTLEFDFLHCSTFSFFTNIDYLFICTYTIYLRVLVYGNKSSNSCSNHLWNRQQKRNMK